jgi:hypothetical protein
VQSAVVRIKDVLQCDGCGKHIDPAGPGVTKSASTDPWWQPFLEDLRADPQQHWHPSCFAAAFGVDELIAAVHREDLRRR